MKRILITGAGGPLGVNITRSLRKAPEPVFLVGTDCNRYHAPLALTDVTVCIPPAKERARYVEALTKLIAEHRLEMIFPTHPIEVQAIAELRDCFHGTHLALPEDRTILTARSKWLTYQALHQSNVPTPRTIWIETRDDLVRSFEELNSRPIWVRGAGEPGAGIGGAALPCREMAHAEAWVDYWNGWGKFIASEFLPGKNLTWCALFDRGQLIACQGRERLEYVLPHVSPSGITGAPAVSMTVHRRELHDIGERAVRAISTTPHGAFFVDMKENAAQIPCVTEINGGRFGTTIHFYTEAGFNFPYLLARVAYGESIVGAPFIDPIDAGVYWLRTLDCGPVLLRHDELPSSTM